MHTIVLFGAKEADVFPGSMPPGNKNAAHWQRVQRHYAAYEHLLDTMYSSLEAAGVLTDDEQYDRIVVEFEAARDRLARYAALTREAMAQYVEGEADADAELQTLWKNRIDMYRVMRALLLALLPRFGEYEDMFVFSLRVVQFMQRRKLGGLALLQSEMEPLVEQRRQLVEKHYATALAPQEQVRALFDQLDALDHRLEARMRLYDNSEEIRAAYSAMARDNNNNKQLIDEAAGLLQRIFEMAENTRAPIEERLQRRDLLQALRAVVLRLQAPPLIRFKNGQLEYAATGLPVTELRALKNDRLARTRMQLRMVALRPLVAGEYITADARLVALVPSAVRLDDFLRADLQKLFLTSSYTNSIFEPFRDAVKGNCRVYRATVGAQQADVLVAMRDIRQDEALYRDYSDSELYRLWESRHLSATGGASTARQQKLRQHIGALQLRRVQLYGGGGGSVSVNRELDATDYKIRIHLLSELLASSSS